MDGGDLRFEGYQVERREHVGEWLDHPWPGLVDVRSSISLVERRPRLPRGWRVWAGAAPPAPERASASPIPQRKPTFLVQEILARCKQAYKGAAFVQLEPTLLDSIFDAGAKL